jgi:hypothetical protein
VDVLVVLGPRPLPRAAPGRDAVDVLDHALDRRLGVDVLRGRRERLDLLEERDEVVRVAEEDLVQLAQRARRRVEERLAAVDGAEPVGREQLGDLGLHLLLLRIEASLAALDARDEVGHGHAQRSHDLRAPGLFSVRLLRRREDLCELCAKSASEERQALARQRLVGEEVLDHRSGEPRQGVLAGAHDAGTVDAREHALLAQPLDRVGRPLARVLGAGVDHVADLLEEVDEHILFEGGERRLVGTQVEARDEAEVDRLQVEVDLIARQ